MDRERSNPSPEPRDPDRAAQPDPRQVALAAAQELEHTMKRVVNDFTRLEELLDRVESSDPAEIKSLADLRIALTKSERGLGQYFLIPMLVSAILKRH